MRYVNVCSIKILHNKKHKIVKWLIFSRRIISLYYDLLKYYIWYRNLQKIKFSPMYHKNSLLKLSQTKIQDKILKNLSFKIKKITWFILEHCECLFIKILRSENDCQMTVFLMRNYFMIASWFTEHYIYWTFNIVTCKKWNLLISIIKIRY